MKKMTAIVLTVQLLMAGMNACAQIIPYGVNPGPDIVRGRV